MSQLWDLPVGSTLVSAGRTKVNDALESLKSCFIGATLPATNLLPGMVAIETTTHTINRRDEANTSWIVIGYSTEGFGGLDRCAPEVAITVEAEGVPTANDRRFTVQVQDRAGNNLAGYYRLNLWLANSDHGAPAGAAALTLSTGTLIKTVTASQVIEVETDATGMAVLVVNPGGGAFTQYLMGTTGNAPVTSLVAAWV
jgi:hypothetical protein